MMVPPGMPNMTSTPSLMSASHMIWAPVRFSVITKTSLFENSAVACVRYQPRIPGQPPPPVLRDRRHPLFVSPRQFALRYLDIEPPCGEIDTHHVAVAHQPDWPTFGRL